MGLSPGRADADRFPFGENWARYLEGLTPDRIATAEASLRDMLPGVRWAGARFLDVGSGSGLFSLAARQLGARVVSFDLDPQSVACTAELRRRHVPGDRDWDVLRGSALDEEFLRGLGRFDVVYAWGSLHHTGDLWRALGNAAAPVADGGRLFVSIYNDQGRRSRWWRRVKRLYNRLPRPLRFLLIVPSLVPLWGLSLLVDALRLEPFASWRRHQKTRGMSPWRDVIDWVGGYPFEVARPEEVFRFCRDRGFTLLEIRTAGGGHGCNEFVFQRTGPGGPAR